VIFDLKDESKPRRKPCGRYYLEKMNFISHSPIITAILRTVAGKPALGYN